MTASKLTVNVYYEYRQEAYKRETDSIEDAFKVVKQLEDYDGGFAFAIGTEANTFFTRKINEEAGLAYWVNEMTGDQFVEYRG